MPARILVGHSLIRMNSPQQAVDILRQLTPSSPEAITALVRCAELQQARLATLQQAEQTWRRILAVSPEHAQANEQLARLYATCNRRSEAIPLILQLVRQQQASDLLIVLCRESGMIHDADLLQRAADAEPDTVLPWLGLAREAEQNLQPDLAIKHCRTAIEHDRQSAPAWTELGRQLLLNSRFDALRRWKTQLPATTSGSPHAAIILAALALHDGQRHVALDAAISAAQSVPDSRENTFRLSQLLTQAGDAQTADLFVQQLRKQQQLQDLQDKVLFSGDAPSAEGMIELIAAYRANDRLLEAFGWVQLALQQFPEHPLLNQTAFSLAAETRDLPLQLVPDDRNPAFQIPSDRYTFRDSTGTRSATQSDTDPSHSAIHFSEESQSAGLQFEFIAGVDQGLTPRMYGYTGGGIGVVDFDGDSYPDMALSQGGLWERRNTPANKSDVLMRNQSGRQFTDVSHQAGFGGPEFGQGIATGDINNDGFTDIVVAGVGTARLWKNMGDGTFESEALLPQDSESEQWYTSVAIADLNFDSAPDLYLTGYLADPDVFDRVCPDSGGRPRVCAPSLFSGVPDQLLISDGAGTFHDDSSRLLHGSTDGKGLGVLIFSTEQPGALSIYVANDTTPNFFWARDPDPASGFHDQAFPCGIALGHQGKSEGSMG
ncbi:MAG: VCBS repeat-containing protein, partial [Planctomycetaceae bacterium]|nr:VCBS repeat-containing protein [Planctomycetaceae bacterium]